MTNTNPTSPDQPERPTFVGRLKWIPMGEPGHPSYWHCRLDDGRSATIGSAGRPDGVVVWEVGIFDSRREFGDQTKRLGEFLTRLDAERDLVRRLDRGE